MFCIFIAALMLVIPSVFLVDPGQTVYFASSSCSDETALYYKDQTVCGGTSCTKWNDIWRQCITVSNRNSTGIEYSENGNAECAREPWTYYLAINAQLDGRI